MATRISCPRRFGGLQKLALAGFAILVIVATAGRAPAASAGSGNSTVSTDTTMGAVTDMTGARQYWAAGYTGKGVDVALIDSGIAPVEGLSAPGKVVLGPDLSFESQDPATRYLDTFGHGTHLAGIIAGRDSKAVAGAYQKDSSSFMGMAPDSRIVSVKVADSQGRTDITQVIAAIDWVVQHKNDNGLNIRVLTLAFGTDSVAGWQHDALVFAAEQAWKQGIFVVISAGNDGPSAKTVGSLSNLAQSPNLYAVGATDTRGTSSYSDDIVAAFSSSGTKTRWVEAVAPGSHIVSLRAPGSTVDKLYGSTGLVGDRFFRGSGTSQAAAVVSGAAALLIQQRPGIAPEQLKQLFWKSATNLKTGTNQEQGAGEIDLHRALKAPTPPGNPPGYTTWSDGLGSLDSARGSSRLTYNGQPLAGDVDIFRAPFNGAKMAALEANASSWSGGTWNGNAWAASSWSSSSWSASSWSSSSWSSSSWSASSWSSSSWSASSWSSSSWSASSWSSSSWSSSSWSSSSWSAVGWY